MEQIIDSKNDIYAQFHCDIINIKKTLSKIQCALEGHIALLGGGNIGKSP